MPFVKGQSGNPAGRKPQPYKNSADKIRTSIAEELPAIIAMLVEKSKDGDVQAAKILLDRVCPALKPQAQPINLPNESASLVEQGNAIIQATMQGIVSPDTGAQLITALSNQGKLIELEQLSKRLERLENVMESRV